MSLVSSYIMAARRRQWMPFWLSDGGRAIVVIYTEGEKINYFLLYFIDSAKTLRSAVPSGPNGHQTLRTDKNCWSYQAAQKLVKKLKCCLPDISLYCCLISLAVIHQKGTGRNIMGNLKCRNALKSTLDIPVHSVNQAGTCLRTCINWYLL